MMLGYQLSDVIMFSPNVYAATIEQFREQAVLGVWIGKGMALVVTAMFFVPVDKSWAQLGLLFAVVFQWGLQTWFYLVMEIAWYSHWLALICGVQMIVLALWMRRPILESPRWQRTGASITGLLVLFLAIPWVGPFATLSLVPLERPSWWWAGSAALSLVIAGHEVVALYGRA